MAGNVSGLHLFQADTGPIPLSLLDNNYSSIVNALNTLINFSNYYIDSGSAGSLVVTIASPQSFSYSDGVLLQIKVAATNNAVGVVINVNALGSRNIVNPDGSAIQKGQLLIGAIIWIMYSGAANDFILVAGSTSVFTTVAIANQVAYNASRSGSSQTLPASTITDCIFNTVNFQQNGTNYSNTTGVFTAPQPGIYSFTASVILFFSGGLNSSVNAVYFSRNNNTGLGLNTVSFMPGFTPVAATSGSLTMSGAALFQLAVNDTVRVKVDVAAGSGGTLQLSQFAVFTGYLNG